jgi:Tfp pilus assembly protein PilO
MSDSNNKSWGRAIKDKVVWFIFAVILALGASYINVRISLESMKQRASNAEDKIERMTRETQRQQDRIIELNQKLIRLEEKLNILLRKQGISPNNLRNSDRNQNSYNNEQK